MKYKKTLYEKIKICRRCKKERPACDYIGHGSRKCLECYKKDSNENAKKKRKKDKNYIKKLLISEGVKNPTLKMIKLKRQELILYRAIKQANRVMKGLA